jgi:DNA-binding response OmpR family regulator
MAKRILIAEDEAILSKVLRDKFEEHEWEVVLAFNGEDALNNIKQTSFHVVVLDLLLPKKV